MPDWEIRTVNPPLVGVRTYRPEDQEACRALWAELTQHHRDLYEDESIGGEQPALYFDQHLAQVGADHIWVAERGGQVIGLMGLIYSESESEVEIEPIIVQRGSRSAGVGQALVEQALACARQASVQSTVGVRYLSVRPVARNLDAIGFFYQAGFEVLGRVELFMDLRSPDLARWKPGPEVICGEGGHRTTVNRRWLFKF